MHWAARFFRRAVRNLRPASRRRKPRHTLRIESLEVRVVPHVSGTVFIDLNQDGIQDADDIGVAGVTVEGTDDTGATQQGVTDENGAYEIESDADNLRLAFSPFPSGLTAGPRGRHQRRPRYVSSTADSERTDQNLSLSSPMLVTTQFFYDRSIDGMNADQAAVLAVPYGLADFAIPTPLATVAEVGSVWGVAYQPASNSVYVSSFLKRHAGLRAERRGHRHDNRRHLSHRPVHGPGHRLAIDRSQRGRGRFRRRRRPTPERVGSRRRRLVPRQCHAPARRQARPRRLAGFARRADPVHGQPEHPRTGRDPDQCGRHARYLAATPRHGDPARQPDRQRHRRVQRSELAAVRSCRQGFDGLRRRHLHGRDRRWRGDLRAFVYAFDPATGVDVQPATAGPVGNLNYPRGVADDPTPDEPGDEVSAGWRPWIATFDTSTGQDAFPVHPQPWLTDIVFDGNNMVLAIRDRFGDQGGFQTGNTVATSDEQFSVIAVGDILRATQNGTAWQLESGGTATGVTTDGAGTNQGPGGGEFYFEDSGDPSQEVVTGGLAQVPGFLTVAATGNDPMAPFSGGVYHVLQFRHRPVGDQYRRDRGDSRRDLFARST